MYSPEYSPSIAPAVEPQEVPPPLALMDAPREGDQPPLQDEELIEPAPPAEALPMPSENGEPEPVQEPSPSVGRPSSPPPALDPVTASLYQPASHEDFQAHRRRVERQETLSFAPWRSRPASSTEGGPRSSPYDKPEKSEEDVLAAFEVDELEVDKLPPGWRMEDGYIQMENVEADFWELKAGCLIRHHVKPRRVLFNPQNMNQREKDHFPVPLDCLDRVRVTVSRKGMQLQTQIDSLDDGEGHSQPVPWTGMTIFQISDKTRQEMGMTVNDVTNAKKVGRKQKTQLERKIRKDSQKNDLSERKMSLSDRLQFQQAKMKELRSFFDNGVWSFQTTKEAQAERTLTSRMLLKWSKNEDGSPRAKHSFTCFNPSWSNHFALVVSKFGLEGLVSRCLYGISSGASTRTEALVETSCRCIAAAWSLPRHQNASTQAGVWSVGCTEALVHGGMQKTSFVGLAGACFGSLLLVFV